ncbi:hypothetical protein BDV95DRAFT_278276 [Massariosphaeria phaeospora]|uniref:Uncharacterized protein n=1 Tax=Massariosphaeria phaeospora TaxID=100035 RepID=A0A7C8IJ39_9PLEO|nr:hypothetical protein BDV95DRAFT_278276 [Massariosphaeria phaeospora]
MVAELSYRFWWMSSMRTVCTSSVAVVQLLLPVVGLCMSMTRYSRQISLHRCVVFSSLNSASQRDAM